MFALGIIPSFDIIKGFYPNFESENNLNPFNLGALDLFQSYIFSLRQISQIQRADDLWEKFGSLGLEKPKDKDNWFATEKYRYMLRCKHAIIEGRQEEALQYFEDFLQGGFVWRWHYIKIDPIVN